MTIERVVLDLLEEGVDRTPVGIEPVADLLVGVDLHPPTEVVGHQERLPHRSLQRRGSDDQDALPVDVRGPVDDLAGEERLAETDLVGDEHPAVLVEQPFHAGDAVGLESGEVQSGADVRVLLGVEVLAVQLPQHPQVDRPRRVRVPEAPVELGQVVGVAEGPEVLEPLADLAG